MVIIIIFSANLKLLLFFVILLLSVIIDFFLYKCFNWLLIVYIYLHNISSDNN